MLEDSRLVGKRPLLVVRVEPYRHQFPGLPVHENPARQVLGLSAFTQLIQMPESSGFQIERPKLRASLGQNREEQALPVRQEKRPTVRPFTGLTIQDRQHLGRAARCGNTLETLI